MEPGAETTRLYEQIRDGKLKARIAIPVSQPYLTARSPPFLEQESAQVEQPVFVARERELEQLDALLKGALAGQGRVVFITGEAGSGKTALAQAFTRRAIEMARGQQAKSWELRATVSLCRMWQQQGRREEARQRLAEIYGWFTEGLDTPDLREARALLEKLSPAS